MSKLSPVVQTSDLTTTGAHTYARADPDLGKAICAAIGAPERTRTIRITIDTDDVVCISYDTFATKEQMRDLAEILSRP